MSVFSLSTDISTPRRLANPNFDAQNRSWQEGLLPAERSRGILLAQDSTRTSIESEYGTGKLNASDHVHGKRFDSTDRDVGIVYVSTAFRVHTATSRFTKFRRHSPTQRRTAGIVLLVSPVTGTLCPVFGVSSITGRRVQGQT